jgi:hypothetical protein
MKFPGSSQSSSVEKHRPKDDKNSLGQMLQNFLSP